MWGFQPSNPLTWVILRNAVDLLKEYIFDTQRPGTASFEIYDGSSPKLYGEDSISFDPTEIPNPRVIDWTLTGTRTCAQIVPSPNFLSRNQLQNLFTGAFVDLTSHIIDMAINTSPITTESDSWSYSTGPGELELAITSVDSNDPMTWLALKRGVEAVRDYMASQNHWSVVSALIFNNENEVGMVAIYLGEPTRVRR